MLLDHEPICILFFDSVSFFIYFYFCLFYKDKDTVCLDKNCWEMLKVTFLIIYIHIYILNYYTHFTITQNLGKQIFYMCELEFWLY